MIAVGFVSALHVALSHHVSGNVLKGVLTVVHVLPCTLTRSLGFNTSSTTLILYLRSKKRGPTCLMAETIFDSLDCRLTNAFEHEVCARHLASMAIFGSTTSSSSSMASR